jgi:RNA polymerase sigma-70 factor (ECF subfamily)
MIERMNFPLLLAEMITAGRDADRTRTVMADDEFDSFYQRTARPLWAYLSRISDRHRADDFLQEAYYRFYRAGAQHESEAHRRNSLFQIATNLVRDAARRGKRYEEVPLEDDSPLGAEPRLRTPAPDHEVATRTDVGRALDRLQPAQRELLWLAYAQGASHEEIAQILGVRSISVRTMLLRARRKLASILTGGAQ